MLLRVNLHRLLVASGELPLAAAAGAVHCVKVPVPANPTQWHWMFGPLPFVCVNTICFGTFRAAGNVIGHQKMGCPHSHWLNAEAMNECSFHGMIESNCGGFDHHPMSRIEKGITGAPHCCASGSNELLMSKPMLPPVAFLLLACHVGLCQCHKMGV